MYTKTEFCKRAGITPETLRHYVDIGLIHPREISSNGYRKYDAENILELWFYRLGVSLGSPLKEIRTWNESMTLEQFHEQLCIREQLLKKQLEEMQNQLNMIQEICYYTEHEMKTNQAVTMEPGLDGYRVFCGEDPVSVWRMAEAAELFPYASIEIDYPIKFFKPRLGICIMKDRWKRLDLSTTAGLELMPARDSLCMSLITSRPLALTAEDFSPLLAAWKDSGREADSDVICSVYCMEGGVHTNSYLLKCRILLKEK